MYLICRDCNSMHAVLTIESTFATWPVFYSSTAFNSITVCYFRKYKFVVITRQFRDEQLSILYGGLCVYLYIVQDTV